MRGHPAAWIAAGALVGAAASALAEEVTLTTYYPSPRGVYEELRTTQNAWLATEGGRVGIGTSAPNEKLEVRGGVRLNPIPESRPPCTEQARGTLWFERDVPGQGQPVDWLMFCARLGDRHEWVVVSGGVAHLRDGRTRR